MQFRNVVPRMAKLQNYRSVGQYRKKKPASQRSSKSCLPAVRNRRRKEIWFVYLFMWQTGLREENERGGEEGKKGGETHSGKLTKFVSSCIVSKLRVGFLCCSGFVHRLHHFNPFNVSPSIPRCMYTTT